MKLPVLSKFSAFLPLILVASACGTSQSETPPSTTPVGSPVTVQLEQVALSDSAGLYSVTGTVRARTISRISPKVMGQILAVKVREGDRVRPGQLLVQIDDRDARTQLAQAEAALSEARAGTTELDRAIDAAGSARDAARAQSELAETTYQRFQALFERNSVSRQEYEEAASRRQAAAAQLQQAEEMQQAAEARRGQVDSRIRQAEAAVQAARNLLSYTTIQAPIGGFVTDKMVEVGQMAAPGQPLLTIEDDSHFEVIASIQESRLPQVSVGQEVQVQISAIGLETEGEIVEMVPAADPVTRSFTVKVSIPSHSGLRSGLFATVHLPDPGHPVLMVPSASLVRRGQLVGVYIVDDEERARFRLIRTGREFQDRIEVLSGIDQDERVVVNPPPGIGDGFPISVSVGAAGNSIRPANAR